MSSSGRAREPKPGSLSAADLCDLAVRTLPVDGAAVVLAPATHRILLASSDHIGERLEELTDSYHDGPGIDAVADGAPVLAADLADERSRTRWPFLTPLAVQLGVRATFALPMQVGAIGLGVVVLHRMTPGGLAGGDLARALRISTAAAIAVVDLMALPQQPAQGEGSGPRSTPAQLRHDGSLSASMQIHQASGMVMVQLGMPIEAALARLRAYAFAHELDLVDVARDVIARRLRFER